MVFRRDKKAFDYLICYNLTITWGDCVLEIKEGDFVMGSTSEGIMHGVVEHIMDDGGTLGTPGSEYALESMPPENPAMSVRVYKKENGTWKPTAYSIGMMYKDAKIVNANDQSMENNETDMYAYNNLKDEMKKAKKPNYSEMIKPRSGGSNPSNPKLYARIVQEAKDKFDVYPSAVANSWVVQEYKRRGGSYKIDQESTTKNIWDGSFDPRNF